MKHQEVDCIVLLFYVYYFRTGNFFVYHTASVVGNFLRVIVLSLIYFGTNPLLPIFSKCFLLQAGISMMLKVCIIAVLCFAVSVVIVLNISSLSIFYFLEWSVYFNISDIAVQICLPYFHCIYRTVDYTHVFQRKIIKFSIDPLL